MRHTQFHSWWFPWIWPTGQHWSVHTGQGQKVDGRDHPVVFRRGWAPRAQTDGERLLAAVPALQCLWASQNRGPYLELTYASNIHSATGLQCLWASQNRGPYLELIYASNIHPVTLQKLITEFLGSSNQAAWGRKSVDDTQGTWGNDGATESKITVCSMQARALSQILAIDGCDICLCLSSLALLRYAICLTFRQTHQGALLHKRPHGLVIYYGFSFYRLLRDSHFPLAMYLEWVSFPI